MAWPRYRSKSRVLFQTLLQSRLILLSYNIALICIATLSGLLRRQIICLWTCCFAWCRMKDSAGWHLSWTSPRLTEVIEQVALNAKVLNTGQENCTRMVAAAYHSTIQLWSVMVSGDGSLVTREIGQLVVMNPSLFSPPVPPFGTLSRPPSLPKV